MYSFIDHIETAIAENCTIKALNENNPLQKKKGDWAGIDVNFDCGF